MILRKLELVNFVSHSQTSILFDKGVTVIYGQNGAGKSSIIDGIKYALFGEKRGASVADLIKRGTQDMSVALEFTIGPHDYRITRMMSMGKTDIRSRDASLTMDGSEIARTVNSVDHAVQDLLDINKELLLNSVFVEQGEIDTLVSINKAEREKTFSKVLGLTLLSQFATDLAGLAKETEARIQEYSGLTGNIGQINEEISRKEANIETLRSELGRAEEAKAATAAKLAASEAEKARIQDGLGAMKASLANIENRKKGLTQLDIRISRRSIDIRNMSEKFEKLTREIDSDLLSKADAIGDYFAISDSLPSKKALQEDLDKRIEALKKMTAEMASLEQGYRAHVTLDKRLNELKGGRPELDRNEANYRALETRAASIKSELQKRQAALETAKGEFRETLGLKEISEEAVRQTREAFEKDRRKIDNDIQEIKSSIGKINEDLKELNQNVTILVDSAKCPLCQQPLTEEHKARLSQEYTEKGNNFRKTQAELAARKKELDANIPSLDKKLDLLNSPKVNQALVDLTYIKTQSEELQSLQKTIESLKESHDTYSRRNEEILDTERKLNNLKYSYEKYKAIEMSLSSSNLLELENRLVHTRNEIAGIESKLAEMEKAIDYKPDPNLRQKIKAMREKEKEHVDLKQSLWAAKATQTSETEHMELLKSEIKELEKEISLFPEKEAEYAKALAVHEAINNEMHNNISQLSKLNTQIEGERTAITGLKTTLDKLSNQKQALENMKSGAALISKLRACFDRDGIQKAIRKDSAVYITNKVREYSSSFELDFDDVRINEDMSIDVSQNGNLESIDMLSGGEKVALAIALRLSLASYVMESIKTMIMDEPTTYLDEDRRSNLKDIIQYTFRGDENPVPQMIIVTHHKELGSVADNVMEVVKENGGSIVTLN